MHQAITDFLADHSSVNTPLPYKWKALKCVVRGVLITHGDRLEKDRLEKISTLLTKVASLEAVHKQSLIESTRVELLNVRNELLRFLRQKIIVSEKRDT